MGKVGWWIESRFAPAALPPLPVRHRLPRHPRRAGAPGRGRRRGSRSSTTAPTGSGRSRSARPSTRASAWWAGWCPTSRSSTRIDAVVELRDEMPGPDRHRGRQRLVGARPPRVRRRSTASATPVGFLGQVDESDQGAGLRGVVGAGAPLAQGGLGPGGRRGRPGRHPDRGLRQRRRDPRVGAGRASPGCWSTTRRASSTRCGGCSSTTSCARGSARVRATHGGQFTWEQTRSGFADVVGEALAGRRVSTD